MWLRNLCRDRAQLHGERTAYTFLGHHGEVVEELSYAELDRRAIALANLLLERTSAGSRVLLAFEPGLSFVVSLFACVYAARIPVPIAPPRLRGAACERLSAVWSDARAELVLSHGPVLSRAAWSEVGLEQKRCLDFDSLGEVLSATEKLKREETNDYAFLQYTSGSTSAPKGVMVTYDALRNNLAHIQARFGHSEQTRGVGWLPMHHDMGLVGGVFEPLHSGFHAVLMSPLDFVQRPLRWLQAIQRYRAEVSGGPTFGYEHCLEYITEEQASELDLRSWRLAFVGAETVRAGVLERFAQRFACSGFRAASFLPCYGMAEATLLISGSARADGPRVRTFDANALSAGRATEVEGGGRALVACGRPIDEHSVRIVNPVTATPCEDGELGEIWVSGPSVTAGYFENPLLTARTFRARLPGDERPYLRTGDVGCIVDGEVFVSTRLKTQIVLRGRNLAPEDVESTAQASDAALVRHGGAAFAVEGAGGDRLVLVQEVRRACLRTVDVRELERTIIEAVVRGFGVAPEVVLVPPGSVPRTTSGKIQRFRAREQYLEAALQTLTGFMHERRRPARSDAEAQP